MSFKCTECDKICGSYSGIYCHWDHCHKSAFLERKKQLEKDYNKFSSLNQIKNPSLKKNESWKLIQRICPSCKINFKRRKNKNHIICPKCSTPVKYQCKKCRNDFQTHSAIKSHVDKNCSSIRKVSCLMCDYSASSGELLKDHMKSVHSVDDLEKCTTCSKCGQDYKTYISLRAHFKFCGIEAELFCKLCPFRTKYSHSLNLHMKSHAKHFNNPDSKNAVVNIRRRLSNSTASEETSVTCVSDILRYCSTCKQTTLSNPFRNSINCDNCKNKLTLKCLRCKNEFDNYMAINYHLKNTCKSNISIEIGCFKCDFKTSTTNFLREHLRDEHPDVEIEDYSICFKCNKNIKSFEYLRKHIKICGVESTFSCEFCPFKTKYIKSLRQHYASHITQKNYLNKTTSSSTRSNDFYKFILRYCSQCEETFSSKPHSNTLSCENCNTKLLLRCSKCQVDYENKSSILRHLKLNCSTAPASFNCFLCKFKTSSRKSIQKHLKDEHPTFDENFTTCTKCGKSLKNADSLKIHYKFCGVDEYIVCESCPFRTKYKEYFNSHMREHSRYENFYASSLIRGFCSKCNAKRQIIKRRTKCFRCKTPLILSCGHCNVEKPTIAELRIHVKQHKGDLHECFMCKKTFGNLENFKMHERVCHERSSPKKSD